MPTPRLLPTPTLMMLQLAVRSLALAPAPAIATAPADAPADADSSLLSRLYRTQRTPSVNPVASPVKVLGLF